MIPTSPGGESVYEGVRVIEVTQIGAGPLAASMMGDFGADVVKIEPPTGDQIRHVDNLFGPLASGFYSGLNRSKRSIVLDLKTESAQPVFEKLVSGADVVMVTMRPEAARSLHADYDSLRAINPRLVYCSITAFGEDGPLASMPGMDIVAQARGGVMGITGEKGGPPIKVGAPIADWTASYLSCWGITMALLARERTGEGQHVAVNLLDGMVSMSPNYIAPYFKTGVPMRPQGGAHPSLAPYQIYEVSDGHMVIACLTEKFWGRLCLVIGTEYAEDERFRTNALRHTHRDELNARLEPLLRSKSNAQWSDLLADAGVPFSPVNKFEEIFEDPQVIHNQMLLELEHPRNGTIKTINSPVKLSSTPAAPFGYPPDLGEHTSEVLLELGLTESEIEVLRRHGAI